MKITKSRLLQIIREEVELHEKNTLELDESFLGEEESDKVTKSEFHDAIEDDQKQAGLKSEKLEDTTTSEDQIIKKGNGVIKPKQNNGKLEIKIR
jgi:hypothetical protein